MKETKQRAGAVRWLTGVGLFGLALVNLLPIAWGGLTSIKPANAVLGYPPIIVGFEPTWDSYRTALGGSAWPALKISLFYSVVVTVLGLVIAVLCAYALDRIEFRFRRVILFVIVACIPLSMGAATLLIPNYIYFSSLNLVNHWFTLPLIYLGLNLPLATWVMKGSMESVPRELDEAGRVDGASRMGVLFRVILPVCKPGLVAAGLFMFIGCWNEFVAGSVMVTDPGLRPIQVAIYQYISVLGRQWGPLTAAATLAVVPILVVVIALGRYLISGLTSGAVKG
jgi:multiple sugar transport system permease protein